MNDQRQREKTKLKEAELETLRNLEEQAKLSAQRLQSLKEKEVYIDLVYRQLCTNSRGWLILYDNNS